MRVSVPDFPAIRNAFSWALLLAVTLFVPAFAQQTATVSGVLVDPSGAGVPDASLTLINQDTGVAVITEKSDSRGNFAFQAVPAPGTFSILVQVSGFSRLEQKDIVLTAGERRPVGTLALAVGSTSDSVTVQAQATPVQTESMERAADLDAHEIEALVARGLTYSGLVRSLPGVSGGSDPVGQTSGSYVGNINGTRQSATIPTLNGVDGSDPSSQGALYATEAIDALAEINVKTSNYQAEYGQTGGAVVNLQTKSGTKQFHGDIYTYFRNEDLNANDYFNDLNGVAKPKYRYVIGGGSIGGPVFIPRKFNTARNKIFFFFNNQYAHQGTPGNLNELTVPTALERTGNFSQSVTVGGALIPVNPSGSKTPYPGNIVPPSLINQYGTDLLSIFPMPNFTNRAVSGGNYNYVFQESPVFQAENYTYKVDFNLTDKLRMYGHNNQINNSQQGYSVGAAPGPTNWPLVKSFYKSRIETPSINLVYTITPTLINETTFGVNHWDEPGGPINQTQNANIQRATYGLQGLGQWYPADNANNVIPIMSFSDVPSAAGYSYDARAPIDGATTKFTIADNLTWVLGKHTLKTGLNIERTRMWKGNPGTAYSGNFAFGKDVNNPLDTGYGYSNALQGVFDTYTESSSRNAADYREASFEEFVQDSWKVNKRLTLELGVRFTTRIPWHQRKNIMAGFNPGSWNPAQAPELYVPVLSNGVRMAQNPATGALLPQVYVGAIVPGVGNPNDGMIVVGQPGVPQGLTTGQSIAVGPRIGFAYDLFGDGKTALRGGFGVSYIPTSEPALCCSGSYQSNQPLSFTPQTYYGTFNSFLSTAGTLFPSTVLGLDETKLGSSYSFSLGVQRDIGHSIVIDVAGVGTLGRNLLMSQNLNQLPYGARFAASAQDPTEPGKPLPNNFLAPYTGYGTITFREPIGNSSYYALQTQANRRFSNGMEFKANFTWSKSMDYGSSDGATIATYGSPAVLNYGESSFDRTFITNLTWLYELPGSSNLKNPLLSTMLGHWNVSGITTFASGAPTNVTFSTVSGVDLIGGGDGQRINLTGNPQLGYGARNGNQFFNTSVFALPPLGYIGNAARDVYRGPGQNEWDLAAFKNFVIRERTQFQLRGEFYNAFNHVQWSTINSAAKFNSAGQQINTLFGTATADRGPRVIQVALRFSF